MLGKLAELGTLLFHPKTVKNCLSGLSKLFVDLMIIFVISLSITKSEKRIRTINKI